MTIQLAAATAMPEMDAEKTIAFIVGMQIVHVVLIWFVSMLFNRDTGTFPNALKFYFSTIALGLAVGFVGAFVGASIFSRQHDSGSDLILWIILCAVGLVAGYFTILTRIYDVGCLGAVGFVLLLVIGGGALSYAGQTILGINPASNRSANLHKIIEEFQRSRKATASPSDTPDTPEQAAPAVPAPTPAASLAPSTPRPVPNEIGLVEPVQIPVMIHGKTSGQVTLPRGMRLKLISAQGDTVTVQYMETTTTILRKSTDFR